MLQNMQKTHKCERPPMPREGVAACTPLCVLAWPA